MIRSAPGSSARLVVLGTGTGVGKTHVAQALVLAWRASGVDAVGLKPIETGVGAEGASGVVPVDARHWPVEEGPSDQALLDAACASAAPGVFHVKHSAEAGCEVAAAPNLGAAAALRPPIARETRRVPRPAPYQFAPPLSPHLAARLQGTRIDPSRIRAWVEEPGRPAVIESAGGLFSPLDTGLTNFDLARALEPASWVLVAPDRLGVLHDLTAAIGYSRVLGRLPDAVVLSQTPAASHDPSRGTNACELATLGLVRAPIVFPLAAASAASSLAAASESLRCLGLLP